MDDEQRAHLEELLRTRQANLRVLERQAATFGLHVPLSLHNSIDSEKKEIDRIKAELSANIMPVSSPGQPTGAHQGDIYTSYERGLRRLLSRIGRDHPRFTEALVYEQRLAENIGEVRRYGDTEARRADRAVVIDRLNELALSILNISFSELCSGAAASLRQAPVERVPPDRPVVDHAALEQLRQQARKAYIRRDWEPAVRLLAEYAAYDPDDDEIQSNLVKARQELRLQRDYLAISELRDEGLWQKVLDALDDLERRQPGYPDPQRLRAWAEQQAAEEAAARQREAAEHARREQIDSSLAHIQIRNFVAAVNLLETWLNQQPDDREAAMLVAGLIENPQVPLELRLRAGRLAGQVGDPRPGVCTLEPAWCRPFPAGEYPIDGGVTSVQLGEFRIARYPVTVWQFRQFWEAGGYKEKQWWTPNGWKWKGNRTHHGWKWKGNHTQPHRWDEPEWTAPNQPVVCVSWYEAIAFCSWLTQHGREQGWLRPGEQIRLPGEAEWEVAAIWDARAGHMRPWQPPEGEIWQNVKEAGIGRTSPVGMFPQGASPCGALDMAGNAWEWCGSARDDYLEATARLREDFTANDVGPVSRGGAHYLRNKSSGCGARIGNPAAGWNFYVGFRVILAPRLAR